MNKLEIDDVVEVIKHVEPTLVGSHGTVVSYEEIQGKSLYWIRVIDSDGNYLLECCRRSWLKKIGATDCLSDLQMQVASWIQSKIPNSTPEGIIEKVLEEVKELRDCAPHRRPKEAADVFIALLALAVKADFSLYDEGVEKHKMNQNTTFKEISPGLYKHVSERREIADQLAGYMAAHFFGQYDESDCIVRKMDDAHPIHYRFTFSSTQDRGFIEVYGIKFIKIGFISNDETDTDGFEGVFGSIEDALSFLELGFVKGQWKEAMEIPRRDPVLATVD